MKRDWIPNMNWWEVHYTDIKTLYDYSIDVQAENAEEAKRIFKLTAPSHFEVWAVWSK